LLSVKSFPVSLEFIREHGGPVEAAAEFVGSLFDVSSRAIYSSVQETKTMLSLSKKSESRRQRLIDFHFDKPSLVRQTLENVFDFDKKIGYNMAMAALDQIKKRPGFAISSGRKARRQPT
jgi:hypothetical protein